MTEHIRPRPRTAEWLQIGAAATARRVADSGKLWSDMSRSEKREERQQRAAELAFADTLPSHVWPFAYHLPVSDEQRAVAEALAVEIGSLNPARLNELKRQLVRETLSITLHE